MKLPNWKVVLAWLAVLTAWAPAQINGQINGGSGGVAQLLAGAGVTLTPSNGLGTVTVAASGSAPAFNAVTAGTNTNALVIGTAGTFNFTQANGTGTTPVTPLTLSNSTAASLGNTVESPVIAQCGNGWGTTLGTSQPVCFEIWTAVNQGTVPNGTWLLQSSIAGSAYSNVMSVGSNGVIGASSFQLAESAINVATGLSLNGAVNTWQLTANSATTLSATSTLVKAGLPFSSGGTTFTVASGTGTCATTSTLVGGVQAGNLTCTGTSGAATVTLTLAATTNAWSCVTRDVTTGADTGAQTGAISTTAVTFTFTALVANDVIQFQCLGY